MSRLHADLRLGTVLAHALPGSRLELRGPDGDTLLVGFAAACEVSPCELRQMLLESARPDTAVRLASVEASLRDAPPAVDHVGLGVYRYCREGCWGHVLATLLDPLRVARALGESDAAAEPGCELQFQADRELGVTLLYTHFAEVDEVERAAESERVALRAAEACLAAELIDACAAAA